MSYCIKSSEMQLFFSEGKLQREWQEQQDSKEVSLANMTLRMQKIPNGEDPIEVGICFSEGSNSLLNIDIGRDVFHSGAIIFFC